MINNHPFEIQKLVNNSKQKKTKFNERPYAHKDKAKIYVQFFRPK